MMAMTSAPRLYFDNSDASGRFTLMMISASLSASALTVAPAAVNSESGNPDLMPAPGSIATSAPSALNFSTVSGEAATRGSDGSISLATAIFMGPPAARKIRRRHSGQIGKSGAGLATGRGKLSQSYAASGGGANVRKSDEENRHQRDDHDHRRSAVLHQLDEALIGLFMGHVIVAVGRRVSHFAMV